jgi:hypothetical protein
VRSRWTSFPTTRKRNGHSARSRRLLPHDLREHGRPGARLLHFAGTGLATLLVVAALRDLRWRPWLLLTAPVAGYGRAWLAHFLVERNRRATFRHPLWSLRGDYRMLQLWLSGRLDDQLRQVGLG